MTQPDNSTAQTLDLDHLIDRLQTARPPPALEPFLSKFIDVGVAIREALRAAEPHKPSLAREIDDGIAASLDPELRAPFLRALTIELRRYRPAEITPGLVDRIGRQLQREFSQVSKPKQQAVGSLPPLSPLELRRIVSLDEAARLSGLSKATIQRCHSDKIIELSPRRLGMRIGDALSLRVS